RRRHDHGRAASRVSDGRRAVPSRVDPYRIGIFDAGQFLSPGEHQGDGTARRRCGRAANAPRAARTAARAGHLLRPPTMILEGLMVTTNPDGTPNISPMGPIVNEEAEQGGPLTELVLRPYHTSTTYANLKRTGEGVFHVTDDVLMIARAAVGRLAPL